MSISTAILHNQCPYRLNNLDSDASILNHSELCKNSSDTDSFEPIESFANNVDTISNSPHKFNVPHSPTTDLCSASVFSSETISDRQSNTEDQPASFTCPYTSSHNHSQHVGNILYDELALRPFVGLWNVNNVCYANSILQTLLHVPLLTCRLLCRSRTMAARTHIARAYTDLVQTAVSGQCCVLSALPVVRALSSVQPQFAGASQHDAHEFLRCFLDQLHEECKCAMLTCCTGSRIACQADSTQPCHKQKLTQCLCWAPSTRVCHTPPASAHITPLTYSPVLETMCGCLRTHIQCLTCGQVSTTAEQFQDLSLGVSSAYEALSDTAAWSQRFWRWLSMWFYSPSVSLHTCLTAYFSAELLCAENSYRCERCARLGHGLRYSRLWHLPDVLTLHLKRFRHDSLYRRTAKISSAITFPLESLDLGCYMDANAPPQMMLYDLFSVICHDGSAHSGHYISYCLHDVLLNSSPQSDDQDYEADDGDGKYQERDCQWFRFDDTCITPVSVQTVADCQPYILFFRRRSTLTDSERLQLLETVRARALSETSPATCAADRSRVPSDSAATDSAGSRPDSSSSESFSELDSDGVWAQLARSDSARDAPVSHFWLQRLFHSSQPGPVDNSMIVCCHGNVAPWHAHTEAVARAIPRPLFTRLTELFGHSCAGAQSADVCCSAQRCAECERLWDGRSVGRSSRHSHSIVH